MILMQNMHENTIYLRQYQQTVELYDIIDTSNVSQLRTEKPQPHTYTITTSQHLFTYKEEKKNRLKLCNILCLGNFIVSYHIECQ